MKFFIKLQKTGLPTFLRSPAFFNLMTLVFGWAAVFRQYADFKRQMVKYVNEVG